MIELNNPEAYKDKHGRTISRRECANSDCNNFISVRPDGKPSGKCRRCARKKKPFTTAWKRLARDWRKITTSITYEQFLEFTKIKNCHYCDSLIPWQSHSKDSKKTNAYFLDRKDNNAGYSVDNCVVCCTRCNRMRSDKFTYKEFMMFAPTLKEIERIRSAGISDV